MKRHGKRLMKIVFIFAGIVFILFFSIVLSSCFNSKLGDHSQRKIEKIVAEECPLGCSLDSIIAFDTKYDMDGDPKHRLLRDITSESPKIPYPEEAITRVRFMARSTWRWYSIVHTDYQIYFFFDKDERLISTYVRPVYTGP